MSKKRKNKMKIVVYLMIFAILASTFLTGIAILF
ncbi:stressosome-associated protein Prli42 [Bacillus benzoevorans]|uniref:Stressosome-associated protein Prli42 n=1 Tax=Bacillus benzoevorans TaxID=1456 RepID=A0A7X0LUU0_9BACI|nr:stressosome-associated protein Prli42 [Bacillus benzoevorans]MBB6444805.1 hypothetical protein [Bacillus benzoevorans]